MKPGNSRRFPALQSELLPLPSPAVQSNVDSVLTDFIKQEKTLLVYQCVHEGRSVSAVTSDSSCTTSPLLPPWPTSLCYSASASLAVFSPTKTPLLSHSPDIACFSFQNDFPHSLPTHSLQVIEQMSLPLTILIQTMKSLPPTPHTNMCSLPQWAVRCNITIHSVNWPPV